MTCFKMIMSENQQYDCKSVHKGDSTIKFQIVNYAKQSRLSFPDINTNRKVWPSCSSTVESDSSSDELFSNNMFFSRHHQNGMHYFKSMEIPENGNFVRTLKNLSATRWSADWESIKAVSKEITRIIKCLIVLRKDGDPKISSTSKSLLVNILDFELMFGLFLLKIILPITSKLSSYIQSTTIDKGNS